MWRPASKSKNALLRAGYSQKQLNDIGKIFVGRFNGQQLDDASTKFTNMVRSSGSAHNLKPKNDGALKAVLDKQKNKSKDSDKKIKETKTQEVSDEVKLASAELLRGRYQITFEEAKKIVGLEI